MDFNISEEEYDEYLDGLMNKVNRGEELHLEQQLEFCDCLQPSLLPQYSFCDDTRFSRLYLEHFMVNEGKFSFSLQREKDLDSFLQVWEPLMGREDDLLDHLLDIIIKIQNSGFYTNDDISKIYI